MTVYVTLAAFVTKQFLHSKRKVFLLDGVVTHSQFLSVLRELSSLAIAGI